MLDPEQLRAMRADAMADAADTAFGGQPVPVDYDEATDEFVAKCRPLETDRMRLVLGVRHVRARDEWRMPATRSQAAQLGGVFNRRVEATPAARRKVSELFADDTAPRPIPDELHPGLFSFQREGVTFLLNADSACLGDDMGLGKTIQAIEWMRAGAGSFGSTSVVVCTDTLKYNWAEAIEKWWPEATPIVVDGSAAKRRKQIESWTAHRFPVLIINYDSLRTHTKLAPWAGRSLSEKQKEAGDFQNVSIRSVVVDEAHKLKDPGALQTMAVKQLGLQAERRLAMTGTPILKSPDDVWSIMNFVCPAEYGSRNQFRNRYCMMQSAYTHKGLINSGLKPETRAEFDSFFTRRFIRRTKEEVLPDLPEKLPIQYMVIPMETRQAAAYKAMKKDLMVSIDGELLTTESALTATTRLRQIACALPVIEGGQVVGLQRPSNKLEALFEILESAPGEPLVIYADSRKFIEFAAAEIEGKLGLHVGRVTGAQSSSVRDKAVKAFQDGQIDVIMGTMGAGAEGLTLTRSNRIVLAQQSWSHATNAQTIDRVHRIGQTRGVQPIVLVSKGTIDVAVRHVDEHKEGMLQQLVRDPAWLRRAMNGEIDE